MNLFRSPRSAITTSIIGMLLLASTIYANANIKVSSTAKTTSQLVTSMVERHHIGHKRIDDNVSSKFLKKYIEDLDPQKLYFYKSDLDVLSKFEHQLDDMVRAGNVQFAYQTFNSFLKRLDERMVEVHKLIDQNFDFTIDEDIVIDADTLPWSVTKEQANERWRKRIKYSLLSLLVDDVKEKEARERLHKRYRGISRIYHQMEEREQLELFLTAMTMSLDPHSTYMSPRSVEDFQIQMRLSLEGIGAALRGEDGFTVVDRIIKGGAAAKDGRLKAGDKIIGVGQEEGEIVDIVEMKLDDVVRLIRGPRDTIVRLQVKTAKTKELKLYELTRQKVELEAGAVRGAIIETKDRIGREAKVGVIRVPSFYRDFSGAQAGIKDFRSATVDVERILKDFRAQKVDAVLVDLRSNGGGALSEAIDMSGLFINYGPIVQIKQQNGKVKALDDVIKGVAWDGPLVVACNRLSASASEIFAGAIKDYNRGVIVGDRTTHGKGTVQNVMPVSRQLFLMQPQDYGALKLTIQQFYRVNGDSTQHRGVRSHIVLPSKIDHMELGESFLDNALPFNDIPQAKFISENKTTPGLISQLKHMSRQRVDGNQEFQKLTSEIEDFVKFQKKKRFSLNEKKFREEMALATKKKDDDKVEVKVDEEAEPDDDPEKPVLKDTFYNNELLNIAVDLTKFNKTAISANTNASK